MPYQGVTDQSYRPAADPGRARHAAPVSRATLDGHVRRILRTLFAFGVFDRRGVRRRRPRSIDKPAHRARRPADRGARDHAARRTTASCRCAEASRRSPSSGRTPTASSPAAAPARSTPRAASSPRSTGITAPGRQAACRVTYADGSDQAAAAALAQRRRRRGRGRRRRADRGPGQGLPRPELPDDRLRQQQRRAVPAGLHLPAAVLPAQRHRPGRPDRHGRRGQPTHRRRAGDRRPGAHAVARRGRRARRGVVPRPGGRHRASPRCSSATSTPAAGCPATFPARARPAADRRRPGGATPASPRRSTTTRASAVGYKWYDAHHLTPGLPVRRRPVLHALPLRRACRCSAPGAPTGSRSRP